jgi:hypothetical protein
MRTIEDILRSKRKPREKATLLIEDVCSGEISMAELMRFLEEGSDVDKGSCADALKHISERRPELLRPHIDFLISFVNSRAPRVKWGIPEAIGNLAKHYPRRVAPAVLCLLRNTVENEGNPTVIRWCAAYALSEIVKHNEDVRKGLLPKLRKLAEEETNNGVKGVYMRAFKTIDKEPQARGLRVRPRGSE